MSDQGIAFRDTSGYVTDPANVTYCLAETYPVTRGGSTFGWVPANLGQSRDRDNTLGNLAGLNFVSGSTTIYFQLDLPATGSTDIHAAFGDSVSPNPADYIIKDTTTSIVTISKASGTTFADATNVDRGNAASWVANEAATTYTMASTALRVISTTTNTNVIAFLRAVQGGGGGTSVAITGVSGTGSVGSVSPAFDKALTGVSGTGSVGSVSPALSIALTGVSGTGSVGSVSPAFSIPLTGVTGTGTVGTVTPNTGVFVALTGVTGTGSVGSVAPEFSIGLTGVSGAGSVGSVALPSTGVFGRDGLGGDDVPRRNPNKGWNKAEWKKRVKDDLDAIATTLRRTYAELTQESVPASVVAKADVIVRPVIKGSESRIDWGKLAKDYARSNALVKLHQEEMELKAAIEEEDEFLMAMI